MPPGAVLALPFALAARLPPFLSSDFPLNDGGMFFAMTRDVLAAGYALPAFTSYNFERIPFAYPPLSFYLAAVLSGAARLDLLTLVRVLPLLANLATVVAVSVLARSLLGRGVAALLAPVIFALIPRGYEWMMMGGGLTRSLGFLYAVTCLGQARPLATRPTLRRVALCGALAAAALASHLEQGLFVLYSLGLMALCYARSRRALFAFTAVGLSAVVLTAPWWATVLGRFGLAPFDAASLTSGWSSVPNAFLALERFLTPPRLLLSALGTLAALGVLARLPRGDLFLPLWLLLIFVATPRSAPSEATVPLALLAAVGLADVVRPGLATMAPWSRPPRVLRAARPLARRLIRRLPRSSPAVPLAATAGLALLLATVFLQWPEPSADQRTLESLSAADRQAMQWVADTTPASARFLVLTSTWSWEEDFVGEWFPVLAGRRSLLTPQGAEWLPDSMHARKVCLFNKVRDLAARGGSVDDLDEWARGRGIAFSAIYISKTVRGSVDWSTLLASARASPTYVVRLDTPAVAVLERTEPLTPRWAASGELLVAQDCQAFADQPEDARQRFEAARGPMAARAWVEEHNRVLGVRPTLSERLRQLGVGLLRPLDMAGIGRPPAP